MFSAVATMLSELHTFWFSMVGTETFLFPDDDDDDDGDDDDGDMRSCVKHLHHDDDVMINTMKITVSFFATYQTMF